MSNTETSGTPDPLHEEELGQVSPGSSLELPEAERSTEAHIKMNPARIEDAYAAQIAAGAVTAEQLGCITKFLHVGKAQHMNLAGLAGEIEIHPTRLHKLFSGQYGAKLDRVIEKIQAYLKVWQDRAEMGSGSFVTTSIVETCWQACDLARAHAIPIPLYGESQTGKSTALEEYTKRNNHGSTIYVRMPAGGHYGKFLLRMAKALGQNSKKNTTQLADDLMARLNPQKLLIIDELHQCVLAGNKGGVRIQTIEFIREVFDTSKCGMILCGTHIAREEFERGKHMEVLEQFRRRGIPPIQLPSVLPEPDMDKIAASYGLPPAPRALMVNRQTVDVIKWRKDLVQTTGLKAYVTFLRMSGTMASKRKDTARWEYVIAAHDILKRLSVEEGKRASKS